MYMLFDNEAAAQAKEAAISEALGYPDNSTATVRYAEPFKHATEDKWALLICDIWSPSKGCMASAFSHITDAERDALVGISVLRDNGWFDYPEAVE